MFDLILMLQQCSPNIHPRTMTALIRQESQLNPLAININTKGLFVSEKPKTKLEAISYATALIAEGKNIDIGIAQINSNNLKWLGLSVEDAFDPCKNLAAASRILQENYTNARKRGTPSQAALNQALSVYNTGNKTRGFENGYVQKVHAHAKASVKVEKVPAIHVPGASNELEPQAPLMLAMEVEKKPQQKSGPELVFKSVDDETGNALVY